MEAGFDNLPDEMIEEIFSYCSFDDFCNSIPFVCERWKDVSRSTCLWNGVTYTTSRFEYEEDILWKFEMLPKLQSVKFTEECSYTMLNTLLEKCPEIKSVTFHDEERVPYFMLKTLLDRCPNLEELFVPDISLEEVECVKIIAKHAYLKKLGILNSYTNGFRLHIKPIAFGCPSLESLSIHTDAYSAGDIRHIMNAKKDKMASFLVHCVSDLGRHHCALPLLSVCTALRNLTVHGICERSKKQIDETISNLKTLRSLTWRDNYGAYSDITSVFQGNPVWPQLLELHIQTTTRKFGVLAMRLVRKCPCLRSLTLKSLSGITDPRFTELLQLRDLQYLFINSDSTYVLNLKKQEPSSRGLKVLFIRNCNVSDLNAEILELLGKLWVLEITSCDVSGVSFDLFAKYLKCLSKLVLHDCRNVDYTVLDLVREQMPKLNLIIDNTKCKNEYFYF